MNNLKSLLAGFVDDYKNYFARTIGAALAYSTLSFIAITLLLNFTDFNSIANKPQVSLMSYIISRYSSGNTYSLVDLSQTVVFFFMAVFSVSVSRFRAGTAHEDSNWPIGSFISILRVKDLVLIVVLLVCAGIDYGLFRLESLNDTYLSERGLQQWIDFVLFLLRIYAPLFLFAITQYMLVGGRVRFTFGKAMFLLFSLWLMYVVSFEAIIYVRRLLFDLIMAPLDEGKQYYVESVLAIPLIAFLFVGFYAAMTEPQRITEGERA